MLYLLYENFILYVIFHYLEFLSIRPGDGIKGRYCRDGPLISHTQTRRPSLLRDGELHRMK